MLGCSPDSVEKQAKFKRKYAFNYPLLADITHGVAEAYGVWQEKSFLGKKYMGVARTTFVIDGNGRIARVFENVKPDGHAAEVTAALREMEQQGSN